MVYASVDDPFDLCVFKCRTSSGVWVCRAGLLDASCDLNAVVAPTGSVVHENTYRSDDHYCFGVVCPHLTVESFEHFTRSADGMSPASWYRVT